MRQRIESTETGWLVAKAGVLVVVLATLSGFTVLSHIVSHASAGRIDCSARPPSADACADRHANAAADVAGVEWL